MTVSILTDNERRLLTCFNEFGVRFMIVGLSSAVLQGAHVVTQDIDLWVENLGSDNFVSAVKAAGGFYIPPSIAGANPPMLGPAELRVYDLVTHMHGLGDFESEYQNAIDIELSETALKLLPIERIISSKEAAGREKDIAALPALRAALAVKNEKS